MKHIQIVLKHYGSQRALARAMRVSEAAVSQWIKAGEIPAAKAIRVERAMGGKIKAVDLVK